LQAAHPDDLETALEAVRTAKISFWDAMLWATAQRAGVRYLFTEDLQDGFALQRVTFVNPFNKSNGRLIEQILPSM
jgi:predicted nucleic acid-binding protein